MRYYSNLAQEMTLTSGVSAGDTVLALSSVAGLPASFPFTLVINPGDSNEEVVTCTALFGSSASVIRGDDGTSATSHSAAAKVRHMLTQRDLADGQRHIAASSAIHGVTGSVVGTTDAQTLINKTISGLQNTITNVPKSALPTDTIYASGTQTLTNKTIDGASNTITGLLQSALPSTSVSTSGVQTLTNKTISGASNTLTNVPAASLTGTVPKANLPADTAYTAGVPVVASGIETFTFGGGNTLAKSITFPAGRFSSAPVVTATIRTTYQTLVVTITTAATTSTVGLTVSSVDNSPVTGNVYVNWIAVQ